MSKISTDDIKKRAQKDVEQYLAAHPQAVSTGGASSGTSGGAASVPQFRETAAETAARLINTVPENEDLNAVSTALRKERKDLRKEAGNLNLLRENVGDALSWLRAAGNTIGDYVSAPALLLPTVLKELPNITAQDLKPDTSVPLGDRIVSDISDAKSGFAQQLAAEHAAVEKTRTSDAHLRADAYQQRRHDLQNVYNQRLVEEEDMRQAKELAKFDVNRKNAEFYKKAQQGKLMSNDLDWQAFLREDAKKYPNYSAKDIYEAVAKDFEQQIINPVEYAQAHAKELIEADFLIGSERIAQTGIAHPEYLYMHPDEVQLYDYYLATEGRAKADKYAAALQGQLQKRRAENQYTNMVDFGRDHPVAGSAISVGTNLGQAESLVGTAVNAVDGWRTGVYRPGDTSSDWYAASRATKALREGARSNIDSSLGQFAYDTGMSMADNLAQMMIFGEAGTLAIMSSDAAGAAAYDALEAGATPQEALTQGAIFGAVEYATEKLPVENLFKLTEGNTKLVSREGVKAILKQAGVEGTEELISSYADTLTDIAINGDGSQFNQMVDQLMAQGMSREDAEAEAVVEFFAVQPMKDFAGGALSGGVMGAGGMAVGNIAMANYGRSVDPTQLSALTQATGDTALAERAAAMNPDSAYDRGAVMAAAQDYIDNLTQPQKTAVGLQYRQNMGDTLSTAEADALKVLTGQKLDSGEVSTIKNSIAERQTFERLTGVSLDGDISSVTAAVNTEANRNAKADSAQAVNEGVQALAATDRVQTVQTVAPDVTQTVQNVQSATTVSSTAQRALTRAQTAFSRAGIKGTVTATNTRQIYAQAAQQIARAVEQSDGYGALKKYASQRGITVQSLIRKALHDGVIYTGTADVSAIDSAAAAKQLSQLTGLQTRKMNAYEASQHEQNRQAERKSEKSGEAKFSAGKPSFDSALVDLTKPHTTTEMRIINDYLSAVDESLLEKITDVYENGLRTDGRTVIGEVPLKVARRVSKLLGYDVSDYNFAIKNSEIQHISERHGVYGKADHTMRNPADLARIGYVLSAPDSIDLIVENGVVQVTSTYLDKNNKPSALLRFTKKLDGTYYVIEAAPDSKWKRMWTVSAYGNKKGTSQAHDVNNDPMHHAQDALATAPDNSISDDEQRVNTKFSARKTKAEYAAKKSTPTPAYSRAEIKGKIKLGKYYTTREVNVGEYLKAHRGDENFEQLRQNITDARMLAKHLGYNLVMTTGELLKDGKSDGTFNGAHVEGRDIYIDTAQVNTAGRHIIGHEIGHALVEEDPKLLRQFHDLTLDYYRRNGRIDEFNAKYDRIYNEFRIEADADLALFEEFFAEEVGGLFEDETFVNEACGRNPTLFRRIADAIKRIIDRITGKANVTDIKYLKQTRGMILQALEDARTENGSIDERTLRRSVERTANKARVEANSLAGRYETRSAETAKPQKWNVDTQELNDTATNAVKRLPDENGRYGYQTVKAEGRELQIFAVNPDASVNTKIRGEYKKNVAAVRSGAAAFGYKIGFFAGDPITYSKRTGESRTTFDSFIDEGGRIWVNLNSATPYSSVIGAAFWENLQKEKPKVAREILRQLRRIKHLYPETAERLTKGTGTEGANIVNTQLTTARSNSVTMNMEYRNARNTAAAILMNPAQVLDIMTNASPELARTLNREAPTLARQLVDSIGDAMATTEKAKAARATDALRRIQARLTQEFSLANEAAAEQKNTAPPKFEGGTVKGARLSTQQNTDAQQRARETRAVRGTRYAPLNTGGTSRLVYTAVDMAAYVKGDTQLERQYRDTMRLAEIFKRNVEWYVGDTQLIKNGARTNVTANGYYANGRIFINAAAIDKAYVQTIGHELWHDVVSEDKGAVKKLYALYRLHAAESGTISKMDTELDRIAARYGYSLGNSEQRYAAFEEYLADHYGDILGDEAFCRRIMQQNGTLWQRIRAAVRSIIERIRKGGLKRMGELERLDAYMTQLTENKTGAKLADLREKVAALEVKQRFDLSSPIERIDNLIADSRYNVQEINDYLSRPRLLAVSNSTEENFRQSMELGGMPSPSIAVYDPEKMAHNAFGDVTLVFSSDTVNPETGNNQVFSYDAWTPIVSQAVERLTEMHPEKDSFTLSEIVDMMNSLPDAERMEIPKLNSLDAVRKEAAKRFTFSEDNAQEKYMNVVRQLVKDGYVSADNTTLDAYRIYARETIDRNAENRRQAILEAKPKRAVGFDEVRYAVVPKTSSDAFRKSLEEQGIKVVTYDGTDADRAAILNSLDDVKFSRPDTPAQPTRQVIRAAQQQVRDTNTARELRSRIGQNVRKLNALLVRPSDTAHVPTELTHAVAEFLRPFTDNTSVFTRQQLDALRVQYENLMNDTQYGLAEEYDPDIAEAIKDLTELLSDGEGEGRRLSQLTVDELTDVNNIVRHMQHIVRDANNVIVNGRKTTINTLAGETMRELQRLPAVDSAKADKSFTGIFRDMLGTKNITPVYFFKRIGGTLETVFDDVLNGQNVWAGNMQKANARYMQLYKQYNASAWLDKKNDTFTFTTDRGDDITLTRQQALSLYATAKREATNRIQDAGHLALGGFVFREGSDTSTPHPLTQKDIGRVNAWLTLEQKAFADAMVRYLSVDMAALGNETSETLHGWRKFTESYYFPYKSSSNYLFSQQGVSDDASLKHTSFTRALTRRANNPIVLDDFTRVWSEHVQQMCMYNALAVPLETLNRVWNGKNPVVADSASASVKSLIERAYGAEANSYIKTFIADVNGGVRASNEAFLDKMLSKFKKAAVFASASVVIQQPSAVMRAMALIDPRHFIATALTKRSYAECMKYCGTAVIKSMGKFDTGTGRGAAEWLVAAPYETTKDKAKALVTDSAYRDDVMSIGAEKADEITWAHIWNAVKHEAAERSRYQPGTPQFYEEAAARFNEVINYTQVYDSVFSRSELMRSRGVATKAMTAFMAEPTVSYNLLLDAVRNRKANARNRVSISRASAAYISSVILNAMLKALVAAARDDDDDKTYLEKYVGKATGSFIDDINPLKLIPYVRDIISIFEGYSSENTTLAPFQDLYDAVKKLDRDDLSFTDKMLGLGDALSVFAGIPVKNVHKDIDAVIRILKGETFSGETTREGILDAALDNIPFYDNSNSANYERLYKALRKGNSERAARVELRLIYNGQSDSRIQSGLIDELKSDYQNGRVEAAEARRFLVSYCGKDKDGAYWLQQGWDYTGDSTWSKHTHLNEAIASGSDSRIRSAISELKAHGDDYSDVNSAVNAQLKALYLDGRLSEKKAISMMQTYCTDSAGYAYDENEAYWKVREWDYLEKHPETKYFSKYSRLYEAIDNGTDLQAAIDELLAHGVKPKTLRTTVKRKYGSTSPLNGYKL